MDRGMIFFQFARRNIRLHWLRSFLAVTGVVIGVAAIASMGILGNSLVLSISESLTDVGDTIVITAHTGGGEEGDGPPIAVSGRGVTDRQVNEIRRAAGSNLVIPIMSGSDRVVIGGETTAAAVYGISPTDLPDLLEVADGTALRGERGAMVGAVLAEDYDLIPGSRIRIGDDEEKLRVTGILEERGVGFDINPDRAVIVSDDFYQEFYDADEWDLVIVKVPDLEEIDSVKASIDDQLNRREDEVDVLDTRAILETLLDTFNRISTFTTAIGGISLIVAGVSIFNVMMMSVTERTREIGVIRSIGARQGEVLRIFLYESLLLGLVGSAIGAVLSLFGGYLALAVMLEETKYLFEPSSLIAIPYGAAFGIATSLLSGAYPAWKASHLSPIEALRHE
ncbi:putative ABC transport system permease protein [Methanofollis sp. W23]|uniref:ABC transporter permease n=1 Tax=Methanofollis sp. W23 TaxID=2817849 RepID=UPI001D7B6E6A|nr:ABC transporter permease [Methanofollis sp. W23]MBP2146332.1 putative ABC transport system permease protein [Methanofollis sp. W23]